MNNKAKFGALTFLSILCSLMFLSFTSFQSIKNRKIKKHAANLIKKVKEINIDIDSLYNISENQSLEFEKQLNSFFQTGSNLFNKSSKEDSNITTNVFSLNKPCLISYEDFTKMFFYLENSKIPIKILSISIIYKEEDMFLIEKMAIEQKELYI